MHSLLKPLKYNIPYLPEYLADLRKYHAESSTSLRDESHEASEIRKARNYLSSKEEPGSVGQLYWKVIIEDLCKDKEIHSRSGRNNQIRDRWLEANAYFNNPFVYFFQKTAFPRPIKQKAKLFSSSTFNALFLEITRDNIITKAELSFLHEKAKDYGVEWTEVEEALQEENPAIHALSNYVLEVCRDGVVTVAEREFLEEKAASYNISSTLLNRMLSKQLLSSRAFLKFRKNKIFYECVVQNLLLIFISPDNQAAKEFSFGDNIFETQNTTESNKDLLKNELQIKKRLLVESLEKRLGHSIPDVFLNFNTFDWARELGFTPLDHSDALLKSDQLNKPDGWINEMIDLNEPLAPKNNGLVHSLNFNGFDYDFIKVAGARHLFDYQISGTNIQVSLAASHPLFPKQDQDIFFKFIATLISAKLLDDRIAIDDFFDTLYFLQSKISKETTS